ncbi:Kynureninase (L-kynurenine hydrolase) [Pseudocyphellaria aurata]|nr:Kynureninase (L-kynurenine hydrolase) [Pseudocyphellaria aurata]
MTSFNPLIANDSVHHGQDYSRAHAESLDEQDSLKHLRREFIIPTKQDLKSRTLAKSSSGSDQKCEPCIYFCGNSLGLQPRRTAERISSHLSAWATKGVTGHFTAHDDCVLPEFLTIDDVAAEKMAPLVGALKSEVAVMETLTANLHLLMASFYRPTKNKYKIILEGKAFPSDHYAVESQIRHNNFDPMDAMILIEPTDPKYPIISTSHILSTIDEHADSTALILLPGIQYYTGQYLDMKKITAHAHTHGLIIGWDLAHAVGNVDVQLHEWGVDFAAWCNYKYVNSGPGAVAGLFVHEKHGKVDKAAIGYNEGGFRPRLSGWWGGDKATKFEMGNRFIPLPGAAGFQLGNPSVLAVTALLASLEIFDLTSMSAIRAKSVALTKYLEDLLQEPSSANAEKDDTKPFKIITPSSPSERGAQLSVQLNPGLLEGVLKLLEDAGAVVDERKPDVIRVAPAPVYNTFSEVWDFVRIFRDACQKAQTEQIDGVKNVSAFQGQDEKGWSMVK